MIPTDSKVIQTYPEYLEYLAQKKLFQLKRSEITSLILTDGNTGKNYEVTDAEIIDRTVSYLNCFTYTYAGENVADGWSYGLTLGTEKETFRMTVGWGSVVIDNMHYSGAEHYFDELTQSYDEIFATQPETICDIQSPA